MTPIPRLRHSIDGYLAEDAGTSLEGPAESLEGSGYALAALDLWMDAALLAHRASRESGVLDWAQAIIDRTGLHPLIGPLPETRWRSADQERGRSP